MISSFDSTVLGFIDNNMHCKFLDWLMPIFTRLGNNGIIFIAVGLILLISKKTRRSGIIMLIALGVGALLCNVWLKPFVARGRPFSDLVDYVLLIATPTDFSFPSGHTVAAFEAAFALSLLGRKWAVGAYIFAVLMAFSRLYLYVHWPTDVLAGAVLGTLVAVTVYWVFFAVEKYRKAKSGIKKI